MDWKALLNRREKEEELDEEFAFHIEALTRENIARGMEPVEAARAARRAMEGVEQQKEACRDTRGSAEWVDRGMRAIRHSVRRLGATPGFTLVAVATLAIGIGATTAMFSLIHGILFAPLPFREPEQLVAITQNVVVGGKRYDTVPVSAGHVREWRKSSRSLEAVAMLGGDRRYLMVAGSSPVPVYQTNVSAEFFRMLGVGPAMGRDFAPEEDRPGKNQVVILSHALWRDRFHSDPGVIGKKLPLVGGNPPEVIGVMPEGFSFLGGNDLNQSFPLPQRTDYWRPIALAEGQYNPVAEFNHPTIARLRGGVTAAAAGEELTRLSQGLVQSAGLAMSVNAQVTPVLDAVWSGVRQPLTILSVAVGAVLLICCLNVANLMVARLLARKHEYAVRASLGAGRGRLLVEMVAEGALLAMTGAIVGLACAYWLVKAVPGWTSLGLPSVAGGAIDWRAAAVAIGLGAMAAVLASLIPALRFSLVDPQDAMRHSGAGRTVAGGRAANRTRMALVGTEVALCVALLVSAGLLLRSFDRLMRVDRGFETTGMLTVDMQLPLDRYTQPEQRLIAWRNVMDRMKAIPGVQAVGAINRTPMSAELGVNGVLREGEAPRPVFEQPMANYRAATPGYFAAAGIALRAGRVFTDAEAERGLAVVSENLARRVWPGQDPVGRRFRRNGAGEWLTVAGVVADVKQGSIEAAAPMMVYRCDRGTGGLSVAVRTALPRDVFQRLLREDVARMDGTILMDRVRSMEELVAKTTARRRWQTVLVSVFAGVAALLAGLGIWGVVSYAVGQRRNEIGLRIALGAETKDVVLFVLGQGAQPVAFGALAGVALAVVTSRTMESLLYGVQPMDGLSFAGAAIALMVVAGAACLAPARRAVGVDPVESLRME